jgi:hypothetical protein
MQFTDDCKKYCSEINKDDKFELFKNNKEENDEE